MGDADRSDVLVSVCSALLSRHVCVEFSNENATQLNDTEFIHRFAHCNILSYSYYNNCEHVFLLPVRGVYTPRSRLLRTRISYVMCDRTMQGSQLQY